MKLIAGTLVLLVGINLIFPQHCSAKFAMKQTRQVPIARLLKNLESQRADAMGSTDKAMVDFRIGRLHAMAYAQKVETAPTDIAVTPGTRYELPDFGHLPDHVQFQVSDPKKNSPSAKEHLEQAKHYLEAAIKTDPSLQSARLGLAWCLDQSGEKIAALKYYREVFNSAYSGEKNSKGGMYDWSISLEAAKYMEPLLDPVKDQKELQTIKSKVAEIEKIPRYVTPILIPLKARTKLENLVVSQKVQFDLDGFGKREYSKWISPAAAWLVIDSEHDGKIDSGLKLVGQSSFWLFWQNGYEVLKGLDDNKNGSLEGSELSDLALWTDKNSNGISDKGEVKPLSSFGIRALSVRFQRLNSNVLWSKQGVLYRDGSSAASFDVLLPGRASSSVPTNQPLKMALPAMK